MPGCYTRTTRQARTLLLLNEIARELTSILNVDELLKRIAELLSRLIDYQMFSILLLDAAEKSCSTGFPCAFRRTFSSSTTFRWAKDLVGYAARTQPGRAGARREQGSALHPG